MKETYTHFFMWLAKKLIILISACFIVVYILDFIIDENYNQELVRIINKASSLVILIIMITAYVREMKSIVWKVVLYVISLIYIIEFVLIMSTSMVLVCLPITVLTIALLCWINYIICVKDYYEQFMFLGLFIVLVSLFGFALLYINKCIWCIIFLITIVFGMLLMVSGKSLRSEEKNSNFFRNYSFSSVTIRYAVICESIWFISYVYRIIVDAVVD